MKICLTHGIFMGPTGDKTVVVEDEGVKYSYTGATYACPICKVPVFITHNHAICSVTKGPEDYKWDNLSREVRDAGAETDTCTTR